MSIRERGEYFVDSSRNAKGTAELVPNRKTEAQRQVAAGLR